MLKFPILEYELKHYTCLHVHVGIDIHPYLPTCLPTYPYLSLPIPTYPYLPARLLACLPACLPACMPAYLLTYLHTQPLLLACIQGEVSAKRPPHEGLPTQLQSSSIQLRRAWLKKLATKNPHGLGVCFDVPGQAMLGTSSCWSTNLDEANFQKNNLFLAHSHIHRTEGPATKAVWSIRGHEAEGGRAAAAAGREAAKGGGGASCSSFPVFFVFFFGGGLGTRSVGVWGFG